MPTLIQNIPHVKKAFYLPPQLLPSKKNKFGIYIEPKLIFAKAYAGFELILNIPKRCFRNFFFNF